MTLLSRSETINRLSAFSTEKVSDANYSLAVKTFQHYAGVEETGDIDDVTERALIAPRCGFRDTLAIVQGGKLKWANERTKIALTYYLTDLPPGLSRADWSALCRDAFGSWSAVCNLKFEEVQDRNTPKLAIVITSGRRDGPSGILADCELPGGIENTRPLLLTLDKAEKWAKLRTARYVWALAVLAHEIGHALGLYHTPANQGVALMNPIYSENVWQPKPLDRVEVVDRYGEPITSVIPGGIPFAADRLQIEGAGTFSNLRGTIWGPVMQGRRITTLAGGS